MKNKFFALCLVFILSGPVPFAAAEEMPQGETLVRELWKNIRDANWAQIEKDMAPEFQSVHEDIARNGKEEIELLKGLNIDQYELSYIQATQTDSLIIVSYRVMTEETIGKLDLPTRAAMRLSGWIKTPEGWKWAFHANLNPLQVAPPDPPAPGDQAAQ